MERSGCLSPPLLFGEKRFEKIFTGGVLSWLGIYYLRSKPQLNAYLSSLVRPSPDGYRTPAETQVGSPEELDKLTAENKDKLLVVDYSTTWCGPCKMVLPKFESLAAEYPDAIFIKVGSIE